MGKVLATAGVFGMVGRDGDWLPWAMLGTPSGMTTCGDALVGLAIGAGMAGSSSFSLEGPSVTSLGVGALKATDGGYLFSVLCRETGVKMVVEAHSSHTKAPWSCWLMAVVISQGGSTVVAREGGSTGVVVGA